MNRADFVNSIYQAALAAGLSDAAARVTAAQAAVESDYGNAAPGNNFFGIKAGSNWNGDTQRLLTHEVVDGKRVAVHQPFRAYPTPEAGVADRVNFMARAFPTFNQAPTVGAAYDALANGRYGSYQTESRPSYEAALNYVNSQYLGGSPVPPADIPSNADPISAGALQNPALLLPYPTPAPLTPRTNYDPIGNMGSYVDLQNVFDLPSLHDGATGFDPNKPGAPQHLTNMSAPIGGLPPPNLPLDLPWYNTAPPTPLPPPSFARPVVAPSVPPSAVPSLLRLPSGKMIAAGTYPSISNPGGTVTYTDDGHGNAVVTNNRLGLMNPAKIGAGTVAGSIVGKTLADTYNTTKPQVEAALSNAASNVGKTASDLGSNIVSGAQGFLGNLFGNKAPSVPAPPDLSPPSFVPTGQTWATKTTINPAFSAWQAKYGNQGGLSTRTSQNTVSAKFNDNDGWAAPVYPGDLSLGGVPSLPAIPAAPPKYLTTRVRVIPKAPVPPPVMVGPAPQVARSPGLFNLMGGGNNLFSYITPTPGLSAEQTHAALMAQQNQSPVAYYNGGAQTTTASGTPLQNIASGQRWAAAFM